MKKQAYIYITLLLVFVGSCKQEVLEFDKPVTPAAPSKGTANFAKFVALGTSYTAGFQAGALFTDGQDNSLGAILYKQFETVGAIGGFQQPDIHASLGYNIFISPNPGADGHVLGRMLLQGASPKPTPQPYALGDLEAVPNPALNPGFLYAGSNHLLNNFSVEAITLGQFLTPATGNWANPNPAVGFSPFYARFASNPGTSKLIEDAASAGGSFFLFWGGMDDFMLYAANGADVRKAPLTPAATFGAYYGIIVDAMLASSTDMKGVLGNFPDIFLMPHFRAVPYNPIPLDVDKSGDLTEAFAGYNQALGGLIANAGAFGISNELKAQIGTRMLTYVAGANKILIYDTDLTDLGPYFDGLQGAGAIDSDQRNALRPYQRVRQTTPADIIPLGAGSVIGTLVGGNDNLINGVTVPMSDQYILVPSEQDSINDARAAFNAVVSAKAAGSAGKLAYADVEAAMTGLALSGGTIVSNVTLTPNINPPTGIFSEDGLHPNARGYAFISNAFITAINQTFGSTIPLTKVGMYRATGLPIP